MPKGSGLNSWRAALTEYAIKHNNGKYIVPKKGSEAHTKVMEIFGHIKNGNVVKEEEAKPKKMRKTKTKVITECVGEGARLAGEGFKLPGEGLLLAGEMPKVKKPRKPRGPNVKRITQVETPQ